MKKNGIILPLEQAQASSDSLKREAAVYSLLADKISDMYLRVCFANEDSLNHRPPFNPFWDWDTKEATPEKDMYQAAFVVKDLYVILKEQLESEGYVVKPESEEVRTESILPTPFSKDPIKLSYYPGTTYVFVPRTKS